MKAGDIVDVFENPLKNEGFEGRAKLIEKYNETLEFEFWIVEFLEDKDKRPRKIKKESVKNE